MEEDLVQAMLADAGLAGLVGRNIKWELLQQGAALPAICLHLIDGPPSYGMGGRVGLTVNLVQFEMLAGGFLEAKTIYRAFVGFCDAVNAAAKADEDQVLPLRGCFIEAVAGEVDQMDGPQPASGASVAQCVLGTVRVIHKASS